MPDHSTSKLPDRIAPTALPAAGNASTDITTTEDISAEAPNAHDEPVPPVPVVSTRKSRSAQRKRRAMEVAAGPSDEVAAEPGANGSPEHSETPVAADAVERES
jgi:hypothetical protein